MTNLWTFLTWLGNESEYFQEVFNERNGVCGTTNVCIAQPKSVTNLEMLWLDSPPLAKVLKNIFVIETVLSRHENNKQK